MWPFKRRIPAREMEMEKKPETDAIINRSRLELKIKAMSLAAEARIIRNIELRLKRRKTAGGKERPGLRDERNFASYHRLHDHRIKDIRIEARATHLARMFLKGKPYSDVEKKTHAMPPLDKAKSIAERFGGYTKGSNTFAVDWKTWQDKAAEYITLMA